MRAQGQNEGTDVKTTVKNLLGKEGELLARAVGQTMKKYHEEPTAKNLRDLNAAKKAFEDHQAQEPVPDEHGIALIAAHKKALAALKKKATGENIRNADAAEKALADYRARTAGPGERRFKTLLEALAYLKSEGWKVEKSKLYADQGKITKEKNGTYTAQTLDEYARRCLQRLDGSDAAGKGAAEQRARLDNEILEERKRKLQRENEIEEGRWILKSEVEQKHTAKLALLLIAIDNFIRGGKLEEAVELVGGDKKKVPEFRGFFKKELRGMLGEYAKVPEFTVPKQSMEEAGDLIADANGD